MVERKDTVKWKREIIPDHKFDFVDINEFYNNSTWMQLRYCIVYVLIMRSVGAYIADAITVISYMKTSGRSQSGSFYVGLVIYSISLLLSTGLFISEWIKARRIVKSRDIAYAYTNRTAYRYYCVRSYSTFCLFAQINVTKSFWGRSANFIYFQLKGWKRLLFVNSPRQILNVIIGNSGVNTNIRSHRVGKTLPEITATISYILWLITIASVIIACLLYHPTVSRIRGNLKEYVCHKIDKRVSELIARKSRKRRKKELEERRILEEEMQRARGRPVGNRTSAVINPKRLSSAGINYNNQNMHASLASLVRPATAAYNSGRRESVGTDYSSSSRTRTRQPRRAQKQSKAMSAVMAPIDQTIYGHSVQHGYNIRLGVDVNDVNSEYDDSDMESNYSSHSNLPLPPFGNRAAIKNNGNNGFISIGPDYPPMPLPRRPASPATSNSSAGSGRYKTRSHNGSHAGDTSDGELSDRYTRPVVAVRRPKNQRAKTTSTLPPRPRSNNANTSGNGPLLAQQPKRQSRSFTAGSSGTLLAQHQQQQSLNRHNNNGRNGPLIAPSELQSSTTVQSQYISSQRRQPQQSQPRSQRSPTQQTSRYGQEQYTSSSNRSRTRNNPNF
ncbi:hypothetical protein BDF19DRAFT_451930 [Syncephalis fuscata]|nr:hypothetical protein BDF19DRAFT_451930 [Syncephalis fuscata]